MKKELTNPIYMLIDAFNEISTGNYSVRLNFEAVTEFVEIRDSFNSMVKRLFDMEERAIDRLRKFARYARDKGVVKGENSFEAYCELSNRYIYNSIRNGKGAIGTDIIARIVDKFPELNVKWLCTGKGNMIETDIDANVNYKAAYEGAMMQIEALHKIIEENKRR